MSGDLLKDEATLRERVEALLKDAKRQGATMAEAGLSVESGLSVTVRLGEVETIEYHRDKGLGVTVYMGKRKGSASTTDFSPAAIRETVKAACAIARHAEEDPCAGLPDPDLLAWEYPDLDLYHPWDIDAEGAIALARDCEKAALALDKRIQNSEGASLSSHQGMRVYGNSHGFVGAYPSTRHGLSCSVIAREGEEMQREYWYTAGRAKEDLEAPEGVGEKAARRALARLGGRTIPTCKVPVVFEAPVAGSLLAHLVSAIRGGALYRKASFLLDHLGRRIFPDFVHIHEQPHLKRALGSAPFDNEGVATHAHDIVAAGRLQSYVLDNYSACRLKMRTTGNAGGVHNLIIDAGPHDLEELLGHMGRGLLVTELMGMGVNIVTGDYSRGASGFWVEGGAIQYPVQEITIAGNLRDMFQGFLAVGKDVDRRGNIHTGSLFIESMTVAGD
ncbi:MAG: metalloprotease PmbA [Gammaproteobacteria bacterium]|nr:MAG: metalloprotease PmbA [Gammaproteobacteria bacterium]